MSATKGSKLYQCIRSRWSLEDSFYGYSDLREVGVDPVLADSGFHIVEFFRGWRSESSDLCHSIPKIAYIMTLI